VKRLLTKLPPPTPRPQKRLRKKALTPLLLAPMPLPLVPTLPLLAPTLLPLRPLLLRLPTLLPLRLLTPRLLLLRLKKRSKSQPFGAMTETRNGRSSFGKAAFFFARTPREQRYLIWACRLTVKLVGTPVDPAITPCGRRHTYLTAGS